MAMLIISYLTWCESFLILPKLKDQKDGQDIQTMLNPSKLHHFFKPCGNYTALYPSLARQLFCFAHILQPLRGKESHDRSRSLQFGISTNDVKTLKESWSCYSSRKP